MLRLLLLRFGFFCLRAAAAGRGGDGRLRADDGGVLGPGGLLGLGLLGSTVAVLGGGGRVCRRNGLRGVLLGLCALPLPLLLLLLLLGLLLAVVLLDAVLLAAAAAAAAAPVGRLKRVRAGHVAQQLGLHLVQDEIGPDGQLNLVWGPLVTA